VSYPIMDIEGIGPLMAAKLKTIGIRTTDKLLEAAMTAKARKTLAARLDVDEKTVLRWANLADRMRIKGVGEPYAELLQAVGVDTVKELKYRNVGNLARAMAEANRRKKLVRLLPSEKRIERWIAEARVLPLKITY
jgi:predicted flap endonuclease-1-like 5' DNA nuclease